MEYLEFKEAIYYNERQNKVVREIAHYTKDTKYILHNVYAFPFKRGLTRFKPIKTILLREGRKIRNGEITKVVLVTKAEIARVRPIFRVTTYKRRSNLTLEGRGNSLEIKDINDIKNINKSFLQDLANFQIEKLRREATFLLKIINNL